MPFSASMIDGSVCGFLSLPLMTTPPPAGRSVSPRPEEVTEPPTNSIAAGSPVPAAVRTSPAMNVWMSPVTKTTSLIWRSRMWVSRLSRSCG